MFGFYVGVPQFLVRPVSIVVWYCCILPSFDWLGVGCVRSFAILHAQRRVVIADFAKLCFLLVLVANGVFVHCDVICDVVVVVSCVLSRFDFDWWIPSMCWCMLSVFGLLGPRFVGFAVRASLLCFAVGPSLQVFRAGTMVERFTARMHVFGFSLFFC